MVLEDGFALGVVARKVGLDDHRHPDAVSAAERVGYVFDAARREVVVAPLLEVSGDARPLGVELRDVEDVARMDERVGRIGQNQRPEKLVAEVVGDGVDAVGRPLPDAVGDARLARVARRVELVGGLRGVESLRVEVDFEVLHRALREVHVEQHGGLADFALPVVPAVVFRRIGLFVEPDVEVGPQKALVGALADVLLELRRGDSLRTRSLMVGLHRDLRQQVGALGNVARDATGRAQKTQQCDGQRAHSPCSHRCLGVGCRPGSVSC